eukprot:2860856-Pleurochrysis_carterae.AAC.1
MATRLYVPLRKDTRLSESKRRLGRGCCAEVALGPTKACGCGGVPLNFSLTYGCGAAQEAVQ